MSRKTGILVSGLLLVGGAGAAVFYFQHRGSPEYALGQVRDAVAEQNALKFERYVDLENFSDVLVDDVLSYSVKATMEDSEGGLEALGSALGASMIENLKPAAVSLVESSVRNAIETGRADSVFRNAAARDGEMRVARLLQPTGVKPDGFQGMTDVQREQDVAIVGLRFRSAPLDSTVTLKLKMEKGEGDWKITEPYDLTTLLTAVDKRRDHLMAEANQVLRDSLRQVVELGHVGVRSYRECEYCSERLRVYVSVTNTGDKPISYAKIQLTWLDQPLDDEAFLTMTNALESGEETLLRAAMDYNQFIDWHETLRNGDVGARVDWLSYESEGSVHTLEDWSDYELYWYSAEQTDSVSRETSTDSAGSLTHR